MVEALATRMNVETELVNPFERVPVRPGAAGGISIEEAAPMLLLSLGLALRV
jgi:Tfp pilus assembly PilM family ATPase